MKYTYQTLPLNVDFSESKCEDAQVIPTHTQQYLTKWKCENFFRSTSSMPLEADI